MKLFDEIQGEKELHAVNPGDYCPECGEQIFVHYGENGELVGCRGSSPEDDGNPFFVKFTL